MPAFKRNWIEGAENISISMSFEWKPTTLTIDRYFVSVLKLINLRRWSHFLSSR
jgi:hypothetical protein